MSKMIEGVIGALIGAGAMYLKDQMGGANQAASLEQELERLRHQLTQERRQREQAEEDAKTLRDELSLAKRKRNSEGDKLLDLEEDLEDAHRQNKRLADDLAAARREVEDLKVGLQASELELKSLKESLNK